MTRPRAIAVIAFHKPDPVLVRRQIETLCSQESVDLAVVAVFDGPDTVADRDLRDQTERAGFIAVENPEAVGVRDAFARGLAVALERAASDTVICYADQDDLWHKDKLSRSIAFLRETGAALVHCDAVVVAEDGQIIAPSLHRYESRRNANSLLGMLVLNTVTGMTAVFTPESARRALPLMQQYRGPLLHDHLTAIAAASAGQVRFLDRPLVDYMQHGGNQLGARLHRSMFRRRGIGLGHIAAYRETSAVMFRDRKDVAKLLQANGQLRGRTAAIFGAGGHGRSATLGAYASGWLELMLAGDLRRATLLMRFLDARFHPFTVE
jgi:hypothetical protein